MNTQHIIAVSVALLLAPAVPLLAAEHPRPQPQPWTQVTTGSAQSATPKATDGTIYDIDFFMAGQPGSMTVTETSVHKINGKPLYNWKEEGGVWKKVRVS